MTTIARLRLGASLCLAALVMSAPADAAQLFDKLRGTWSGTGTARFEGGKTESLKCSAYYTGSGDVLKLALRCATPGNKIEMRGQLKASGSSVSGSWEERTFNAEGAAAGSLSDGGVNLRISGAVSGSLSFQVSGSRQTVNLSTSGTALRGLSIGLGRN